VFAQLTVLVLAGLAGPALSLTRLGLVPVVIGELLAGVILGNTGFGVIDARAQPLVVFSAIGFAMLMLSAGARVDVGSPDIRRGFRRGVTSFAAVVAVAVPLGLAIDAATGLGRPLLLVVLIAGSSAAIVFPIFAELGLPGATTSAVMSWIAVADSATVVLMPLTLTGSSNVAGAIAGDVAIVAGAATVYVVAHRVVRTPPLRALRETSLRRGWALQLRASLLALFGLSAIAQLTGASTLVAGFAAGMLIARLREPERLALQLSGVANGFFVPVFFVLLGAELNLRALVEEPSRIGLALALAAAAVSAHVVAAAVTGRKPALATGLAASAQLGLPAAAAALGLGAHLLSPADAAALVAAGCLTLIPASLGGRMIARAAPPRPPAST